MCGVPGRAENGTQISLYSAELYNPGQKTEYRYAIHPVVMSQNNLINFILNIQPYVTESPNKSCNVVKRNQRIMNRVACYKKKMEKVVNFNER